MEIKAIETVYNGYRFRSRLEARWAVFFDAAGIKYEYEPQGFVLSDGTCYLPDFYLPEFQTYAEVKPILETPDKKEIYDKNRNICKLFRDEIAPIILLRGGPWDNIWNEFFAWETNDDGGGDYNGHGRFIDIGDCYDRAELIFMIADCDPGLTVFVSENWEINKKVCSPSMVMHYYPDYSCGIISAQLTEFFDPADEDAFSKARLKSKQARFEHGECG